MALARISATPYNAVIVPLRIRIRSYVAEAPFINADSTVSVRPVKLGVTLGYQLTTTVALEAKLPGGATWQIARPAECAGIIVVAAEPPAKSDG